MFRLTCIHIIFCSVLVAEWPPFGKQLLTQLTIFSLCILTLCSFSYFPFWSLGSDLVSDCFSSRSLHTFLFLSCLFLDSLCDIIFESTLVLISLLQITV